MPIPERPTLPTDRNDLLVQVTDDGSYTLLRAGTNDSFHSGCGALSETRHVYLNNSGILDRLHQRKPTRILEIGLGTTMAMLVTLDEATQSDCELHYHAIESDWITIEVLDILQPDQWVSNNRLVEDYRAFRKTLPDHVRDGVYRWQAEHLRKVEFHILDFETWSPKPSDLFHAVYFDPFCPESCPELWTVDRFSRLRDCVTNDATLATYSCSRLVRDHLDLAGWNCQRVPGPDGGKREVLIASPR